MDGQNEKWEAVTFKKLPSGDYIRNTVGNAKPNGKGGFSVWPNHNTGIFGEFTIQPKQARSTDNTDAVEVDAVAAE